MTNPERDGGNRDEIARRAHERFEQRGGEYGDDQSDWFEAEREIRQRNKVSDDDPSGSDAA